MRWVPAISYEYSVELQNQFCMCAVTQKPTSENYFNFGKCNDIHDRITNYTVARTVLPLCSEYFIVICTSLTRYGLLSLKYYSLHPKAKVNLPNLLYALGHTVAQLVEVKCYRSESR
jgi:hypothetical protein